MARKPTDKQLFKMKNEWLGQFYEEVKPKDFYRAVFPEGSFEREGHPEDEKCNGVLTVIEGEKARNYIVFDELNMIDEPIYLSVYHVFGGGKTISYRLLFSLLIRQHNQIRSLALR